MPLQDSTSAWPAVSGSGERTELDMSGEA
jgi:hypothetical protein